MLHSKGITRVCTALDAGIQWSEWIHHAPSNTATGLFRCVQNENSEQTTQIKFYLCKLTKM